MPEAEEHPEANAPEAEEVAAQGLVVQQEVEEEETEATSQQREEEAGIKQVMQGSSLFGGLSIQFLQVIVI